MYVTEVYSNQITADNKHEAKMNMSPQEAELVSGAHCECTTFYSVKGNLIYR